MVLMNSWVTNRLVNSGETHEEPIWIGGTRKEPIWMGETTKRSRWIFLTPGGKFSPKNWWTEETLEDAVYINQVYKQYSIKISRNLFQNVMIQFIILYIHTLSYIFIIYIVLWKFRISPQSTTLMTYFMVYKWPK